MAICNKLIDGAGFSKVDKIFAGQHYFFYKTST